MTGHAIGACSGQGGVATAAVPFLGGWLLEVASWRAVFMINVPVAALVVAVTLRHMPETRDRTSTGPVDTKGAVLCTAGLAGVTFALIEAPDRGPASAPVVAATAAGLAALVWFVATERRQRFPMLPTSLFASRQFTAATIVTFAVYGAFGGVFFLLLLHLQVVAGFSPLAAGTSMLPVTGLMIALSARSGQLAQRIGPRLPMTAGPLLCGAALLLMLRIGADASYVADVLPAVAVLGLGLALMVAPLTATALAAVDAVHAGVASGVNNAVARAAALLAVAVLPAVAGLSGADYTDSIAFADGFQFAAVAGALLLALGAAVAAAGIRNPPSQDRSRDAAQADRFHCAVDGPPLQPHALVLRQAAPTRPAGLTPPRNRVGDGPP